MLVRTRCRIGDARRRGEDVPACRRNGVSASEKSTRWDCLSADRRNGPLRLGQSRSGENGRDIITTGGVSGRDKSPFVVLCRDIYGGGCSGLNHRRWTQESALKRTEKTVGSLMLGYARLCSRIFEGRTCVQNTLSKLLKSSRSFSGRESCQSNLEVSVALFAVGFVDDLDVDVFLEDERARGDALHQEYAGADGAAGADDGFAADDGGVGVDGDMVFDRWMAFLPVQLLSAGERASDEADALIHFDVAADLGGFADDRAGAVVDEKVRADLRAGMKVDAGAAMRPFRHDAGDEGDVLEVKLVREALDGDGLDEGVCDDDFLFAERGGVAFVGGFDVGLQQVADPGKFAEEFDRQRMSSGAEIFFGEFFRRMIFETFIDLIFEPFKHGVHQCGGFHLDFGRVNELFVEEPGKEKVQEVARDRGDGGFRGQVFSVEMINAAHPGVGSHQLLGQPGNRVLHGASIQQMAAERKPSRIETKPTLKGSHLSPTLFMNLRFEILFALTPALSPEEREKSWRSGRFKGSLREVSSWGILSPTDRKGEEFSGSRAQHGFDDAGYGNARHAAEINGALAKETRRTGCIGAKELVARIAGQAGAGEFRRGAAKRNDDRRAERGGYMHRPGIVGEQDAAEFERGAEFAKRSRPGE